MSFYQRTPSGPGGLQRDGAVEEAPPPYTSKGWIAFRAVATVLLVGIVAVGIILPLVLLFGGAGDLIPEMKEGPLRAHLTQLQAIATKNGGNRAPGGGYDASLDYVEAQLKQKSDLVNINRLPVTYTVYSRTATPELAVARPAEKQQSFVYGRDFLQPNFSGVKTVTDVAMTFVGTGCDKTAYATFPESRVALVERGDCDFIAKVEEAVKAKASAILIYDTEPGAPPLNMDIGSQEVAIPVLGLTHTAALILELSGEGNELPSVSLQTNGKLTTTHTENLCAESSFGDPDSVIVVGSHLDGVTAGPGINDNGSGSALNLELALKSAEKLTDAKSKLRFCWWGAEELGLIGSAQYVQQLPEEELQRIACYLNFDMQGSPNGVRATFDGKSIDPTLNKRGAAAAGSVRITDTFVATFEEANLAHSLGAFGARAGSDWGPFLDAGVPSGGLFSGAGSMKTEEERQKFGGLARAPHDPCYHQECDTIDNIDFELMLSMTKAAAGTLQKLARRENLKGWLSSASKRSAGNDESARAREFGEKAKRAVR